MERRNDIRAAMQSLLSPGKRPDSAKLAAIARPVALPPVSGEMLTLSEGQRRLLREIQAELRESGVCAEPAEIAGAVLDALAVRPALCRGLLAAYLLEG